MSAVLHLFIVENRERCIFCGKTAVFREGVLARGDTRGTVDGEWWEVPGDVGRLRCNMSSLIRNRLKKIPIRDRINSGRFPKYT